MPALNRPPDSWLNEDELEERINLARLVQNKIRSADCHIKDEDVPRFLSFRMNLLQFSLFLCWDLKSLRQAAVLAGLDFYNALANIESFVASCTYPHLIVAVVVTWAIRTIVT